MCTMNHQASSLFILIPAAGSGQRFGAALPKQYLRLRGQTVLEWTVVRLRQGLCPTQIAVVLSAQDAYFDDLPEALTKTVLSLRCGGKTRAESVRNGLAVLMRQYGATANSWIAVHDAVRPCVPLSCLRALKAFMNDAPEKSNEGALLAMPLADTLKGIADDGDNPVRVTETMDRHRFRMAQTPQIFRAGVLSEALNAAGDDEITDEAQAVERWCRAHGAPMPRLLRGSAHNIKITYPEDIVLAEAILEQQAREKSS